MTTIRDAQLWNGYVCEATKIILGMLDQDEVVWAGAIRQMNEVKEELTWYNIYREYGHGEGLKVDILDHTIKLLDFLGSELKHKNRRKARHYAQSLLKILS